MRPQMPRSFVSLGKIDFIRFKAVALDHFIRGENHLQPYVDMMFMYGALDPELDTIRHWKKAFEDEYDLVRYVIPSGRLRICGLSLNQIGSLIWTEAYHKEGQQILCAMTSKLSLELFGKKRSLNVFI
ncbi:MAG: hypothetical protein EZS28_024553 [Streblomastix strix]|uniref:Uncharacterized protein n=1 Tax=Streblomastix strix TaxID=222440 RepID=A0A5J4VBT8_9EUKA|nr:MAG: hypothetical protein EZS28_024553 [Streblomastix strix]